MARPVAEDTIRRIWLALTAASPERLAYAARVALTCTLTLIVAEIYRTPEIALTVYLVFFLNPSDRMSGVVQSVALTLIMTLVLGLVLLVATLVLSSNPLRLGTMAALSFTLVFLSSASKLGPTAATVALVVVYSLDVLGQAPDGELASRGLLYAWLFVGIPAGVTVAVNLLLAPSPHRLALRAFSARLRAAASALEQGDTPAREALADFTRQGDADLQKYLKLATLERTVPRSDIAALLAASDCTVALLSAVQLMVCEAQARPPDGARQLMAATLREMAEIFERGAYPAAIAPVSGVEQGPPDSVRAPWYLFNAALSAFGEPRPPAIAQDKAAQAGFFAADAFFDTRHLRHAIKTTAAAMLCYLIYSALSWPGIHTALITCFIVSLGTAAETIEKLSLRVLGCLAGTAAGLFGMLVLIPRATDIGDLGAIVFAGALAGAWVAAGGPRIAYAGLQFAFAFFLCVVQGSGPGFDLVVARDRVIGILLGNLVSYVVMTRIWPVSVGPRIDQALQSAREQLAALGRVGVSWQRWRLNADAQARLLAAETDIGLAAFEPPAIRPTATWLAARRDILQQARPAGAWLLAAAESPDPSCAAPAATRLHSFEQACNLNGLGERHHV